MDARPLALAAGVALAALALAWLERDMRRIGAGWRSRLAVAVVYLAMLGAWAGVVVGRLPVAAAWTATVVAVAVTVAHRPLAERLDGVSPARLLAAEVGAIRVALSVLTTSRYERVRLQRRARALDRWSSIDLGVASELIALVQEDVAERLERPQQWDPERERRISELLDRLEAAAGPRRAVPDSDEPARPQRERGRAR